MIKKYKCGQISDFAIKYVFSGLEREHTNWESIFMSAPLLSSHVLQQHIKAEGVVQYKNTLKKLGEGLKNIFM